VFKRLRDMEVYFVGHTWPRHRIELHGWGMRLWSFSKTRYNSKYSYIHIRVCFLAFDILYPA
jgi:hypothetical protein